MKTVKGGIILKRSYRTAEVKLFADAQGLAAMLDVGRSTADKIGRESGARVQYGRCVRYDVGKVKAYLDGLADDQGREQR